MPDFVRLQVLPAQPAPLVALHSSAAQVADVPAQPMSLPAAPPRDGMELWEALPADMRSSLAQLARLRPAEPVTLWLDVQVREVAAWPWELLAPAGAPPFSCTEDTPLARAFPGMLPPPPQRTGRLRALAAIASPGDAAPLRAARTLERLRGAVSQRRMIELATSERTTPKMLAGLAQRGDLDLLLLVAHGAPGTLLLEDERGETHQVTAAELPLLLGGLRLPTVVLASCDGATSTAVGESLAHALLRAGAPGVIAMHGKTPEEVAETFLAELLASLAAGDALEVAAARGRRAVVAELGSAGGAWALPACWQRVPGRPLAALALAGGAATMAARSEQPGKAAQLVAGGALGALAVFSLAPLIAPLLVGGAATVALPAVVELLKDLGLNIYAGYLGGTLGDVWQRSGRAVPPSHVTCEEVAGIVRQIAARHGDAAAELADLARRSDALAELTAAIRRETAASQALLAGLNSDVGTHRAALAGLRSYLAGELSGLRADVRAGFGALFQQGARTEAGVARVDATTQRIEQTVNELWGIQARERERQEELLRTYLRVLVERYAQVTLSRFIELKRGSGDPTITEPFLQDIYVALATDGQSVPIRLRRRSYPARVVARAQRLFSRATSGAVPPDRVRTFAYLLPEEQGLPATTADDPRALLAQMLDVDEGRWTGREIKLERPEQAGDGTSPPQASIMERVRALLPSEGRSLRSARPGRSSGIPADAEVAVRLSRPELVAEAFSPRTRGRQPRLVLLGDPGSGKSTVLRYTTVLLAQALLDSVRPRIRGWGAGRVPLLLSLGTLAEAMQAGSDDVAVLRESIARALEGGEGRPRHGLAGMLPDLWPRSVLLLDGLDELSATPGPDGVRSPRSRAARAIRALAEELPDTPIVVTCRVLPYRAQGSRSSVEGWQLPESEGWRERVVEPFTFGQVRQFVRGWYDASVTDAEAGTLRAADLLRELGGSRALRQAIAPAGHAQSDSPPASPLLLTMLTILHFNSDGRPLPPERDELYEKLVDLLLHRWEPRRGAPAYERDDLLKRLGIQALKGSTEPLRRVLHQVAFDAHRAAERGGDGRGVINADALRGRFQRYFEDALECDAAEAAVKVRLFLEVLRDDASLLTRIGDDAYALPHLTFQEYLAGCALADGEHPVFSAYELWRGPDADRWREPLLLMCGRLRQNKAAAREGANWVKRLCAARYPLDPDGERLEEKSIGQRQRDALLAAESYEVLGRRTRIDREQAEELEDRLRAALLLTVPPPERAGPPVLDLTPPQRDQAARALARLRDPRPGVCVLPASHDDPGYWAELLPAGVYEIGTQSTTQGDEQARKTARLRLSAFRVARYPVTVWQFRQFWQDSDGYGNKRHWPRRGWDWKNIKPETKQPQLWNSPDWTADNQPVIGVSWYEAMAFCRWLDARGRAGGWLPADLQIRLPSEAQWEVAAMWDAQVGAIRPWSPPEDELWQNCEEAGIGRTSPVGLFPQGASPCGALDMAGNAWEWCASAYEDYPRASAAPRDDFDRGKRGPVIRGGAYYLQNTGSGWGARVRDYPNSRYYLTSFRVCVCSRSAV